MSQEVKQEVTRASTEIVSVETEREGHVSAKVRRYNLRDFMLSECGEGRVERDKGR